MRIRVNYQLVADFDDKTFFPFEYDYKVQANTAFNGKFKLVYNYKAIGGSYLLARLVLAPNVDDLSKVFDSAPEVVVPNPKLSPEYTYNLEIGISKRWLNKIHLGLNTYYTWYKNAITLQVVTAFEDNMSSGNLEESSNGSSYERPLVRRIILPMPKGIYLRI